MKLKPDNDALNAKRTELIETTVKLLPARDSNLAERIVDSFCRLTPPEDPPIVMTYTTLRSGGYHGGESRKPGNLWLNWRKLFGELGDVVLNTVGAMATPWLIPFAALSLWNKLWAHATITLSREQAAALFAMWHRCNDDHRILRSLAYDETVALFTVFQWPALDLATFNGLLGELESIDCIEVSPERIWLREWVKTTYD
jgi:hypothetical protein